LKSVKKEGDLIKTRFSSRPWVRITIPVKAKLKLNSPPAAKARNELAGKDSFFSRQVKKAYTRTPQNEDNNYTRV